MTDFIKNYRKAENQAEAFNEMKRNLDGLVQALRRSSQKTSQEPAQPEQKGGVGYIVKGTQDPSIPGSMGYNVDTKEYTYTYKNGDSLGRVIEDLGLQSGNGLWGQNGDVAYYTKQLSDQGMLDRAGNIPVGTTIRLRRRN